LEASLPWQWSEKGIWHATSAYMRHSVPSNQHDPSNGLLDRDDVASFDFFFRCSVVGQSTDEILLINDWIQACPD